MLAAAELGSVDVLLLEHAAQGGDGSGHGFGVAIAVVAGVEADLVAAGVDLAQQGAQARVVEADAVLELGIGVLWDEIEGDGSAGALVEVHDVLEAEAVRVQAVIAATGAPLAEQVALDCTFVDCLAKPSTLIQTSGAETRCLGCSRNHFGVD